jgi:hypothetical protein
MISIQDVLDDRFFYRFSGCAQSAGRTTSMMLWNPPDSGVAVGVRQSFLWSSNGTEFNLKWRTETHGVVSDFCNSLSLKSPAAIGKSKVRTYADKTGLNGAAPETFGYVLTALDRQCGDVTFAAPIVLNPGTGIVVYPDTTAAINWTWGCFYEELELPVSP